MVSEREKKRKGNNQKDKEIRREKERMR